MYDDLIFTNYEFKNFVKQTVSEEDSNTMQFANEEEKELCIKWQNIDLSRNHITASSSKGSSPAISPTSLLIKSIENDLLDKPNKKIDQSIKNVRRCFITLVSILKFQFYF